MSADTLEARATAYAAEQYEVHRDRGVIYCVHLGGDGGWHFSHEHDTAAAANACCDRRRAATVARILANGGHSEL